MVFYEANDEFCLHQGCSVQAHQMTEFQNKTLILQLLFRSFADLRRFKALFSLLLSNEGFEKDSLTENTAIPRISSCLWTIEKEKERHLYMDLYIQEREQEKEMYIYI